jgi:hypothetical protein
MVDVPSEKLEGVTPLMIGIGFNTLTVTEPGLSCGKAVAKLVIVTVLLGAGTMAGAVYSPLPSIVPTLASPPSTPFTQKFIGEPVVFDWVLNWTVWLTRTVLFGAEM